MIVLSVGTALSFRSLVPVASSAAWVSCEVWVPEGSAARSEASERSDAVSQRCSRHVLRVPSDGQTCDTIRRLLARLPILSAWTRWQAVESSCGLCLQLDSYHELRADVAAQSPSTTALSAAMLETEMSNGWASVRLALFILAIVAVVAIWVRRFSRRGNDGGVTHITTGSSIPHQLPAHPGYPGIAACPPIRRPSSSSRWAKRRKRCQHLHGMGREGQKQRLPVRARQSADRCSIGLGHDEESLGLAKPCA